MAKELTTERAAQIRLGVNIALSGYRHWLPPKASRLTRLAYAEAWERYQRRMRELVGAW